jgi:poly-gamma-glutamate synthesis protein (capsule biosynthesis protein)
MQITRLNRLCFVLRLCVAWVLLMAFVPRTLHAQSNGQQFWVVTAPFPTVADGLTFDALKAFWQGDGAALKSLSNNGAAPKLFLTQEARNALVLLMGEPSSNAPIAMTDAAGLVGAAWAARPAAFAVLPFDQLEARWKLLHLNGINLLDKQADANAYPLRTNGPANRDVNRMTVVAMTGVTALVRGTAVMMERKGINYPGEKIREWMTTADIAHISNEVSFWDQCPKPSFNSGVVMCSDPRYIELLKYIGTDVIELTGNHLWDRGWQNLSTTLKVYEDLGWPYFGGGRTAATALNPVKYEINGNKIAFVGCNWFGANWATDTRPGSARCGAKNPQKLDLIVPVIQQLVKEGYLVIATLQYLELYSYSASAQQVKDFDALRAAGAVVVNGSQGHHAQGFDVNEKGFAHYGTGNFFFGDQAGIGTHQTFVDRHVFYNGKYLGVDLRTAYIMDNAQPVPMNEKDRAKLMTTLFRASGY